MLTPTNEEALVLAAAGGATQRQAAERAGIGYSTLRLWLSRGRHTKETRYVRLYCRFAFARRFRRPPPPYAQVPPRLTLEQIERAAELVERGGTPHVALAALGVHRSSLDALRLEAYRDPDSPSGMLSRRLDVAHAVAQGRAQIVLGMRNPLKWLQLVAPEDWNPKTKRWREKNLSRSDSEMDLFSSGNL